MHEASLYGHNLVGLGLKALVDNLVVLVGEVLNALLLGVLLVLGKLLVAIDGTVGVLARVTNGNAALLGELLAVANELLAALLRGLRERQANRVAVV